MDIVWKFSLHPTINDQIVLIGGPGNITLIVETSAYITDIKVFKRRHHYNTADLIHY